ncbi:MAG: bifunctional hydroxymethylpyrimidine kinase/phosphomethylpyrimidine kinase [Treponemataceae bacterium]|nr:bifunctional hydroxymethylpyrimidine kinase/phosphomethylpyrimidine kinase [Treponemataceae bacterium]
MQQLLTIAGSDSSGGAGIQADLKTFAALGCYGMSVICAVTAQNTESVCAVHPVPVDVIKAQIAAIFQDLRVDGVKIGMMGNAAAIRMVACQLVQYRPPRVVLDPVMVSKSGYSLLEKDAQEVLIKDLFPLVDLVTPNIYEAEVISGKTINNPEDMKRAADAILSLGASAVLIKGGHLDGPCNDVLMTPHVVRVFSSPRIETPHTHGTGCSLSSAIAALWARGFSLEDAVMNAKYWLSKAIKEGLPIGKGHGPVHHFHAVYDPLGNPRPGISLFPSPQDQSPK